MFMSMGERRTERQDHCAVYEELLRASFYVRLHEAPAVVFPTQKMKALDETCIF